MVLRYHSGMARRRALTRDGMRVTTIALPSKLHRQLGQAALDENAALTELVREAVEQWLARRRLRSPRRR